MSPEKRTQLQALCDEVLAAGEAVVAALSGAEQVDRGLAQAWQQRTEAFERLRAALKPVMPIPEKAEWQEVKAALARVHAQGEALAAVLEKRKGEVAGLLTRLEQSTRQRRAYAWQQVLTTLQAPRAGAVGAESKEG